MEISEPNSSNNIGMSMSTSALPAAAQVEVGPDLEEIQTEGIGFQSLAGDSKIQLLPKPWPGDALPPPTSSLLSLASSKSLLAAAGPSELIIANTNTVRGSFAKDRPENSNTRPFTPELTLSLPTRVSQVTFTSDEKYLVVSAESNGGLAVYDVQNILQGGTNPAFEISTLGVSLRALVPNPSLEKASFLALVTTAGDLLVTNLENRQLVTGSNGPVLKSGVSCVCWSRLGKQLVAGLGDGSAYQLTPEGIGKAEIPKPPSIHGDDHVSFISWLETHSFLIIHTPTTFDLASPPSSTFHLVIRQNSTYLFRQLLEPCFPSRSSGSSPYYFMSRLREFPPNLRDALVLASTVSPDIGLLTLSATPLTNDTSADKITNVYTITGPADDTRRAQLPMAEDAMGESTDTWPIGAGFDLSVKEKVIRPIPSEEIDESATPLPAYLVLNNLGVLSAWWFVYSESVRQGVAYPGLALEATQQTNQKQPAVGFGIPQANASAFGAPAFGSSTPPRTGVFGVSKPTTSPFGSPNQTAGGGSSNAFGGGAFGSAATLGSRPSAFAAAAASRSSAPNSASSAAFGQPAFGSSSALGVTQAPAFGSVAGIGAKASPWSTPTSANNKATQATSTFGSTSTAPSTGGFGSYANMGGFASAPSQPSSGSIFSQPANSSPNNDIKAESAFGGSLRNQNETGVFGSGPTGFSLGSTFKGDGTAKDDGPKPDASATNAFFGNAFGSSLTQGSKAAAAPGSPITREANMEDEDSADEEVPRNLDSASIARQPLIASSPLSGQTANAFSEQSSSSSTKQNKFESSKAPQPEATSERQPPSTSAVEQRLVAANKPAPITPNIKPEPRGESESPIGVDQNIPEAPLPPDTMSKISFAAGDSSTSSSATQRAIPEDIPEEIPLPSELDAKEKSKDAPALSDPIEPKSNTLPKKLESIVKESGAPISPSITEVEAETGTPNAPFPPDFLSSNGNRDKAPEESNPASLDDADEGFDDEGSGEDITKDVSIDVTPESSFVGSFDRSPVGGRFTNIPRHPQPQPQPSRPLFGEIGSNSVPFLPPPTGKEPESPRSPSPIRGVIPAHRFRPESSRSVSAPNAEFERLEGRKAFMPPPVPSGPLPTVGKSADERRFEETQRAIELRARKLAEEEQDLNDEHDEQIREELASEVQPTRDLHPFLAHQDYVGEIEKPGIPGQIERVYRDINSMIDTLGLNARSLEAFVKGHSEGYKEGGRTKDDLEEEDDWCLIELEDLSALEHEVAESLEVGRVSNVRDKLECCHDLLKDLVKIRTKHNDVKYLLASHTSPEHVAALRAQPLSAEQSLQLHDLRHQYTTLQHHLAETEEGLTLLRAKISSVTGSSTNKPTPTVDAVMSTIMKMTSLVEKKSGDIDVLESQMRKLRFSSVNSTQSREGSPARFSTPQKMYSSPMRTPGSGAQLFFTPQSHFSPSGRFGFSRGSPSPFEREGTPLRKKLDGITTEDVHRSRSKLASRKKVVEQLREAVTRTGAHIRKVDYQ